MRLAIRGVLVAVGVALLIAGGRSPQGTATDGGSHPRGVVSIVTETQAADPDRPDSDERGAAEREGRDDAPVTGAAAERARAAAQDAVPGATVRAVERDTDDDGTRGGAFEVELVGSDGTTVEVELDGAGKVLGTDREDDRRDD